MKRGGFTLWELLGIFVVLVTLISCLIPTGGGSPEISRRTQCGSNLRTMYQVMYTYSVTNADSFPVAGAASDSRSAIGFRGNAMLGRTQVATEDVDIANNITASLWMMVRDGSVQTKQFICLSARDTSESMADAQGKHVRADRTWDFGHTDGLSFSSLNMYHTRARHQWSAGGSGDWVLMGDDNNATEHPATRGSDEQPVMPQANSRNHGGEGQNLLFADGHVSFTSTPFEGPSGDNVYSRIADGQSILPTLRNSDDGADDAAAANDVVLIPLTGNNGVSLSGAKARAGVSLVGESWREVLIYFAVVGGLAASATAVIRLITWPLEVGNRRHVDRTRRYRPTPEDDA